MTAQALASCRRVLAEVVHQAEGRAGRGRHRERDRPARRRSTDQAAREQSGGHGRTLEQADRLAAVVRAGPARLTAGRLGIEDAAHDGSHSARDDPGEDAARQTDRHPSVPAACVRAGSGTRGVRSTGGSSTAAGSGVSSSPKP